MQSCPLKGPQSLCTWVLKHSESTFGKKKWLKTRQPHVYLTDGKTEVQRIRGLAEFTQQVNAELFHISKV